MKSYGELLYRKWSHSLWCQRMLISYTIWAVGSSVMLTYMTFAKFHVYINMLYHPWILTLIIIILLYIQKLYHSLELYMPWEGAVYTCSNSCKNQYCEINTMPYIIIIITIMGIMLQACMHAPAWKNQTIIDIHDIHWHNYC